VVFYMPGRVDAPPPAMDGDALTPRRIVAELDRFVIGQAAAKRAVAVALRNRVRRKKLPKELAEDVLPKNILLIGPTGVGKTEIARRLARLVGAPFLKVEASKFTEVGYVGRDVESMIRDMVEIAVNMVRQERRVHVRAEAGRSVEKRILDLLLPPRSRGLRHAGDAAPTESDAEQQASWERSRETFRRALQAGELDERVVEVEITPPAGGGIRFFGQAGME
jgi:ATP-dependent HslUV protease ATP-binding subunit HslU